MAQLDDAARKEIDAAFRKNLAEAEGSKSGAEKPPATLHLAAVDAGSLSMTGSFCDMAPKAITGALGLLDSFGWLIPDKIENLMRAFLKTARDTILPLVCGGGASPETVQKKG